MSAAQPDVIVYTDGGCRPNPGPGGWGVVILEGRKKPRELSGGEPESTNNRMELTAAVEGLKAVRGRGRVRIVTDSQYLRRGITEWIEGWRRRGWKTAGGDPVLNRDLWEALDQEVQQHDLEWRWTKGHAGDRWNERADQLASAAMPRPQLPVDDPKAVHLWVAVAWSGKKQAGSWAVLMTYQEREKVEARRVTGASANRLHLMSAIGGLEALTRPTRVHLYTASDYLKDGATAWVPGWRARGWVTREGKAVSHRDLWQQLDRLGRRHEVVWHVVEKDTMPEPMRRAKDLARQTLSPPAED